MADLRVQPLPDPSRQVGGVSADGGGDRRDQPREQSGSRRHSGAEELAVLLGDAGAAAMEAHYEVGDDGEPRVRIVDGESGETVAVMTPEELRQLAGTLDLPPGLLVQTST